MKTLVTTLLLSCCTHVAAQSAGSLDPAFSGDGVLLIHYELGTTPPLGQGNEHAVAMHISPDGSVLVAGHAFYSNSDDADFVVAKVDHFGNLDTSFGVGGKAVIHFDVGGDHKDLLGGMHVYGDGRILLVGKATSTSGDDDFAVARLHPDGSLDTTFSADGKLTIAVNGGGGNDDLATSVLVVGGGSILVGGRADQATGKDFAVIGLLSDGTLHPTFGIRTYDFSYSPGSDDRLLKMSQEGSDYWLLGSASESDGSESPAIAKIDYRGYLKDAFNAGSGNFSGDGKFVLGDSRAGSRIAGVAVTDNGRQFAFVGSDTHPATAGKTDCAVSLVNTEIAAANGDPVGDTFNFNLDPNPALFDFNSSCSSAAFSTTNQLVLAGQLYPDDLSGFDMALMRLNQIVVSGSSSSYAIDSNFGVSGRRGYAIDAGGPGTQNEDALAVVGIDWSRDIVAAGSAMFQGSRRRSAVIRVIGESGLDPSISITSPAQGSTFTEGDVIHFVGQALDQEDGDISTSIEWSSGTDGVLGSGGSLDVGGLSRGNHLITATVLDSDRQSAGTSIGIAVQAPPGAPTVVISSPVPGSTFEEGQSVSFVAAANDPEDGDISANVVWHSNHDGLIGIGAQLSISTLSVNTHDITASVTDSSGNPDVHAIFIHVTSRSANNLFGDGFE